MRDRNFCARSTSVLRAAGPLALLIALGGCPASGPTQVSGTTIVSDDPISEVYGDPGPTGDTPAGDEPDPVDIPADAVTKSFQHGVDGYQGAKAVAISTLSSGSYNNYQGTTFTDDVDWCIGDNPSYSYSESPLMRFETLDLPAGAKVLAASLTITFTDVNESGQKVFGRYLLVSWATESGYGGSGVGWMNRMDGVPWGAPGGRAEGVDYVAGKTFEYSGFVAYATQKFTAALHAEIVQGWMDDPSSNHGVILNVDLEDHHTGFRQPQNSVVADRPILSITYVLE